MTRTTYVEEARSLFWRFAERHELSFQVETDLPTMLFCEFHVQKRLRRPIILGLQNSDELNFDVGTFWSYFFPFPKVVKDFDLILDAWISGTARIVEFTRFSGQSLEIETNGHWTEVYRANGWPFRGRRKAIYSNLGNPPT